MKDAIPRAEVDRTDPRRFELWFAPLAPARRGYAFPCDASGRIKLDGLSQRARANYMLARTLVGRDFACPAVVRPPFNDEVESIVVAGSGGHLAMHVL
jgi:hypothetical protein